MIMRPTEAGCFSDTEVFNGVEALADLREKDGNLAAGCVKGIAGRVEESGVDSECEKAVGFSKAGARSKRGDLASGTPTARPLFAV
jgi:hypothetical protein